MSTGTITSASGITVTASGRYHAIDDVALCFGIDNIVIWLRLGASDTGDTVVNGAVTVKGTMSARAQHIINWTESLVDSWFRRSRYLTPFTLPPPLEVEEICSHLSGSKMYEPRTTDDYSGEGGASPLKTFVMAKRKEAMDTIKQILAGKMELNAALDPSITEAPALVRTDSMRMHQVRSQEINLDALANMILTSDGGQQACFSDGSPPPPTGW